MTREGELLWAPDEQRRSSSKLAAFLAWAGPRVGRDLAGYDDALNWSLEDLEGFWSSFAEWYGVRWQTAASRALGRAEMPGAQWFPGARLNYAEHVLYPPAGADKDEVAVFFAREDGLRRSMTWRELRTEVAAVRRWLVDAGVGAGDRVAALLPNSPHALVAMLASASLGAVWSSCSPDFGPQAVADRFTQIEPVVLFTVDGYHYGGKRFDITPRVDTLRKQLPSLRATVLVSYLDDDVRIDDATTWADLVAEPATLAFEPVRVRRAALCSVLLRHDGAAEADRARARRHPGRARQAARAASRPRPGRPVLLVLHDRLDDVEPAGVRACCRCRRRALRRQSRLPRRK